MNDAPAPDTAIVLGVGPLDGLGAALCRRFAAHGLHVIAAGRSAASLAAVVAQVEAAGGRAEARVADATREADVIALFAATPGPVRLAVYNAGNNTPGPIATMTADYFERAWRTGCFGGFLFAREAARTLPASGGGTVIFTGASASLRGRAGFGAFNAAKSGLRALAQAFAKEGAASGLHVAHVVVDGAINGEKIRTAVPEYAARLGTAGMIGLDGLADAYWYLHTQAPTAWTFELDLRTSQERW